MRNWTSVLHWTIYGTTACVVISIVFNTVMFGDLGSEALKRSLLSATILPILLGVPLFFYWSMRLRGLAYTNLRLGQVARTDSLTACLNRGAFTAKVSNILGDRAEGEPGALLMIDADNFKSINDLHGHNAGDEALTIIARSIRSVLRSGDLVGRMGGEEFAVYLPVADQQAAEAVAERVRRSVNLAIFEPDGKQRTLSVSIGGAVSQGPARFADLFRTADQRLYCAKQMGRNRVVVVDLQAFPQAGLLEIA